MLTGVHNILSGRRKSTDFSQKGDCWRERAGGGRRVSNRKRLTKLLEGAKLQVGIYVFLYISEKHKKEDVINKK